MPDSAHSIAPAGLTAPRLVPPLDPGFMSPALWSRAMAAQCQITPGSRPLTKFENRGIKLGHGVWDVVFERV